MVNQHRWHRKIVALLHSPPDKALDIPGSKARADGLIQLALHGLPPADVPASGWRQDAERADLIAAAADRLDLPPEAQVSDWARTGNSVLLHPLSGQHRFVPVGDGELSLEKTSSAQTRAVAFIAQSTSDPKQRFLLLWRFLPDQLKKELPLPWELLPADPSMPAYAIMDHARVASAIAASLPRPATLLFSIGPVQGFIATARKTRDLWMGSFLLSYLTWSAIRVIAGALGPDHVLYPSLLGQPLADHWLQQEIQTPEGLLHQRDPERMRLATLPNRFMAIVPADEAEKLAREAESAVREEWKRLADAVWREMKKKVENLDAARSIWDRHISQFPEIYWAVYRWAEDASKGEEEYRQLTGSERFQQWVRKPHGKHAADLGTLYAGYCELVDKALGARKALRDFDPIEEPGGKCTLCGERQALSDLGNITPPNWSERERIFWREIAQSFPGDIAPEGRERLCGICTVKRFAAKAVFEKHLSIPSAFPSTDSIASASFVSRLFEHWEAVKGKVEELLQQIKAAGLKDVAFVGMDIPRLTCKAQSLDQVARELLRLDGEWLFSESYEPDRVRLQHGVEIREETARDLQRTLREIREKARMSPDDYYAVLLMDGDEMGKWLSGTHRSLPMYRDLLHPRTRERIEPRADEGWRSVLNSHRLVSPSLHGAFSHALSNFALHCVPFIVEDRYAGRLVYAGGDDVLAFLPMRDALPAARELRGVFSGEAERLPDGQVRVEFGNSQWAGWLPWDGRTLLTLGNRATASIGIAIAHRLHPLRDVMRQARQAEEDAKELYGRNAICVRWLKRSGEQVQMGAKFYYTEHDIKDTLHLLLRIAEKMGPEGPIARGFATDLMQASWVLAELPPEAQNAEVKRLLRRRQIGEMSEEEIKQTASQLVQLAHALNSHADKSAEPHDLTRPQHGLVELAKWLTLLRFLSGGGE